ncbi:MAG TPA: NADH-quinone oxidoreductase subunit H, partial [bacterium]
ARAVGLLLLAGAGLRWGAEAIPSWIWFFGKTYLLVFVLVWLRGTFPRLRADQLMGMAWKFLLPMTLVNIAAAGVWVAFPFPVGTALSALLLAGAYAALIALNRPASLEPRTYLLAE